MAFKSRRRPRTSFPRSITIGFKPNSINCKAAKSPAGPAPTIITSCLHWKHFYNQEVQFFVQQNLLQQKKHCFNIEFNGFLTRINGTF
jgi:hypothetical protein